MKQQDINGNYKDFLNNDDFIRWQLLKTDDLNQYWENYRIEHPEQAGEINKAANIFKSLKLNDYTPSEDQYKTLRDRLKNSIYKKRKIRLYLKYASAAACIMILALGSFFIYNNWINTDLNTEIIVGQTQISKDIQLISANKVISLSQDDVEIRLTNEGKAQISVGEEDRVESLSAEQKSLNKLIVPHGKKTSLVLPDGTKVWLNSGTEMEFPSAFKGKTRDVYVKGEIYLNVAKDESKPFFVHTSQFDVQVVGTSFNISSYEEDAISSVVLVEGKVKVNFPNKLTENMTPSEMLIFGEGKVEKKVVNTGEYTSWRDGVVYLDKTPLSEILSKIGRYYNVSFETSNTEFARTTYSGKLILSDNLDDVMASVAAFSSIQYHRENNRIIIKKQH